jgi:hypothetical protein
MAGHAYASDEIVAAARAQLATGSDAVEAP